MISSLAFRRAAIVVAALALNAGQAVAQRVSMPVGYRLTFIGDKVSVNARVVDNSGRTVPNAPLSFRVADPAVAAVSSRGEVVAKRKGSTKVWAVYGRDSASSLILVEQWASKFAFAPTSIHLDALGARQPLKVNISDAGGVPVAGEASTRSPCRSVNDRVASLTPTGDVVAVGNGLTFVRCADKGIADSIRVEVQQKAVSISITNKPQLSRRTFGDTFSVRILPKDRQGREVVDAKATWASLNPDAVSVDPKTGKGRAVNSGDAKILVQIGDVADSTTINVAGGPAFTPIAAAPTLDTTTTTSKASVSAQDIVVTEGDTATVSALATDSLGAPIANPRFRISVGDRSIVKPTDSMRVVAVKPGQSRLIVEYGGRTDSSKTIYVRPRSVAGASGSGARASTASTFVPPGGTFKDSLPVHTRIRDSVVKEIHTDPRTAASQRNLIFLVSGVGAIAEHLSHPSDNVTEDRTGVLSGGSGTLSLWRKLELSGTARFGTLSSVGTVGEPLTYSEAEGSLGFFVVPEAGIRVGYMLRNEKTTISTQAWTIPKISLVTRFSFIGDLFNTYAAFSILPKATFTGAPNESPSLFSRAGEAGLEFRKSIGTSTAFNGGLTYYAEQFSFDNSPRVENFSAIRFRLGLQRGW